MTPSTSSNRHNNNLFFDFDEHDVAVTSMSLERSVQGIGQVVVVAGESGVGKTTYVYRFLSTVDSEAVNIFHVEGFEQDAGIPYAPWTRFISSEPELAILCPKPIGLAHPTAQNATELMTRTINGLVSFSIDHPSIIVIDELEMSDEPTREILLGLSRQIERSSILLMIVVETPFRDDSPLKPFTSTILRNSPSHFLELSPVSDRQVRSLIEKEMLTVNPEGHSAAADEIIKLANGNRLYLQELLPHLQEAAVRSPESPVAYLQRLPTTLEQIIDLRLSELSNESRQTLQIAALIGDVIDFDLLVDVTADDPDHVLDHLEEALSIGLLKENSSNETQFSHGVIRQALRQHMSLLRQRQFHRKILSQLSSRPNVQTSLLARHAEQAGELKTAFDALLRAGHEAQQVFALREAGGFFERALTISSAAEIDDARQDVLRLDLADCFFYRDWDRAEREISRVIARSNAREDELTHAMARYRQAMVLYEVGDLVSARELLIQVIPLLEDTDNPQILAEGLKYYGFCCSTLAEYSELHAVSSRLLELNETLDDPIYRAIALHFQAHSMIARGIDVEHARLVGRESMEILAVVGRLESAAAFAWVIFHSVDVPSNLHRPKEVLKLIERGNFVDQEGDRLLGIGDTGCTLPFCYYNFLQGDWDTVRNRIPEPASSKHERWSQTQKDIIHVIGAELAHAEGRYSDATELLSYIAPSPEVTHRGHSFSQWLRSISLQIDICLKNGQVTKAQTWAAALDRALEENPYMPGELIHGLSTARILLADDQLDDALHVVEEIIKQAKTVSNMLVMIQGLLVQSEIMLIMGNIDRALQSASDAIKTARRTELGYITMLARLAHVTALAKVPERRLEARDIALDLEEQFKRLGATPAQSQVQRLFKRGKDNNPGGITAREMDVLRHVLNGLTDQEIASQLYISPRTVGTHISNMLNKTGMSNRVELTTWAIMNGIIVGSPT